MPPRGRSRIIRKTLSTLSEKVHFLPGRQGTGYLESAFQIPSQGDLCRESAFHRPLSKMQGTLGDLQISSIAHLYGGAILDNRCDFHHSCCTLSGHHVEIPMEDTMKKLLELLKGRLANRSDNPMNWPDDQLLIQLGMMIGVLLLLVMAGSSGLRQGLAVSEVVQWLGA